MLEPVKENPNIIYTEEFIYEDKYNKIEIEKY